MASNLRCPGTTKAGQTAFSPPLAYFPKSEHNPQSKEKVPLCKSASAKPKWIKSGD